MSILPVTDDFISVGKAMGRVAATGLGLVVVILFLSWGAGALSGDASGIEAAGELPKAPVLSGEGVAHTREPAQGGGAMDYAQAPMLRRAVAAGDLPPVEERLPDNPLVVVPPEQKGPYGGALRRCSTSPSDAAVSVLALADETLVRWTPTLDGLRPNLARDWKVEDGGKTFVLELRHGVRWSDGQPFTADDIMFWADHVLTNPKLTPVVPDLWKGGGQMVRVEKVGRYKVRLKYSVPKAFLMKRLAGTGGRAPLDYPAHYFKQFHPDFTSKAELDKRVNEGGFDHWYELFQARARGFNPKCPTLNAWHILKPPPAQPIVMQRNPYYWKVDPDGHQLPYINRIETRLFNKELIGYRAIEGTIDFQVRHISLDLYPLLARNQERGDYRLLHWAMDEGAGAIMPNMTPPDPGLAEVLDDRRVRVALSVAINRKRISKVAYFGLGEPRQASPPAFSPFFNPDLARLDTEYDPKRANRLLDEAGLDQRDSDGYRLRPDGKPLTLVIEANETLIMPEALQLVVENWRAVGVRSEMRILARTLFYARMPAALHDVTVAGASVLVRPMLDDTYLVPGTTGARYGIKYLSWFKSDGEKGVKPPPAMRKAMTLHRKLQHTADPARQRSLTEQLLEISNRQRWTIGLLAGLFQPVVASNRLRNVPETSIVAWGYFGTTGVECFALEPRGGQGAATDSAADPGAPD